MNTLTVFLFEIIFVYLYRNPVMKKFKIIPLFYTAFVSFDTTGLPLYL